MIEFRSWPKTKRLLDIEMIITQKLDGTNAQIYFKKNEDGTITGLYGSRSKWITDLKYDNHGFAAWCEQNWEALFTVLGEGRHYGEWVGKGIQSGEGMDYRKFFSFDYNLEVPASWRSIVEPVPVLYRGIFDLHEVYNALQRLKIHGSMVNGFEKPEGIIIDMGGIRYKCFLDNLLMLEKYLDRG